MSERRRVLVVGAGAVGARAARQLASSPGVEVVVHDVDAHRVDVVVESLGPPATAGSPGSEAEVAVLAVPGGPEHVAAARALVARGVAVVSCSDRPGDVAAILSLDAEGIDLPVVAGAAFSPGLTCLLAAHAAAALGPGRDAVDEIHVARSGAGGPACQLARREALARRGTGRPPSPAAFPPPTGRLDVRAADLAEPTLLRRAFPRAGTITAGLAASPAEWLLARFPPPRRPTGDGPLGAVRVEVRAGRASIVYGAVDRAAVAAGAVAAEAVLAVLDGRLGPGVHGLADLDPLPVLKGLAARGVKAAALGPTVPGPNA